MTVDVSKDRTEGKRFDPGQQLAPTQHVVYVLVQTLTCLGQNSIDTLMDIY